MSNVIFDLETTGLQPIEKIKVKVWNDSLKQYDETVKEVSHNRILSIVVKDLESNKEDCFCGDDEKLILNQFSGFLKVNACQELIGFNVEFDLNFIRVRSFVNGINLPNNFPLIKITDLRKILNSNQYACGSLSDYCKLIGTEAVTENGKSMPIFFENKQWDKIREHNLEDLKLTELIYQRCKECNLL